MPDSSVMAAAPVFTRQQSDRYARNLAALRRAQPAVARIVEGATIKDGVVAATGRDGAPTFQRLDSDGRRTWLGQSSMPTVSAAEMFCNARADDGNVTLPGVLTGAEPLAILQRIPRYRALFVLEADPLNLKLAMHLHDYTGEWSAGRLVLILEDDLSRRLSEYFEQHLGCELPAQMFNVPQRSASAIAELQRRLEQAGEVVLRQQARAVETLARSVARRSRRVLPEGPRTALLSIDPSPSTADQVHRIERGLRRLGWPVEVCTPDGPDQCHVVARLRAMERVEADWILMINSTAGSLRPILPPDMPVVSWLGPDAVIPAAAGPIGPQDFFVASSRHAQEQLIAAGAPRGRAFNIAPGTNDAAFFEPGRDGPSSEGEPADVAVVMDVPDDQPEANGITLPSYVSLWQELQKTAARDACSACQANADHMLAQAQSSAGLKLLDAAGRKHIRDLLETRIIPAAIAAATLRALREARLRVAVWGVNWPDFGKPEVRRGPLPPGVGLAQVFGATKFVVLPWVSASAVQAALDALAVGAQVLLRTTSEFLGREHPDLIEVIPGIRLYDTVERLLRTIRRAQASPGHGPDANLLGAVRTGHAMSQRLIRVRNLVRDGRP